MTLETRRAILARQIGAALHELGKVFVELVLFVGLVVIQTLRVFCAVAPTLLKVTAVGGVIGAAALTWPKVYAAYGGAPVSAFPAVCVVLAPVAFALALGPGALWGALVFSALVIWLAGVAIPGLPPTARGLAVVAVIGGVTFYFIHSEAQKDEQKIR